MINMTIMGGLGNQIFQWACARNLQEKYEHYIGYNLSFYQNQDHRSFCLDKFPNVKFNTKPEPRATFPYQTNVVDYFDYDRFTEPTNKYESYSMFGYWQSEKYFKENENIIREELDMGDETRYNIEKHYNWLGSEDTVSIHIRRTDYITSSEYHPVQPISYYNQALDLVDHDKILVFSDDIEWCKNTLPFNKMEFAETNSDIEDLYLMSQCNNNIIANSSFSWWGAWLNQNQNKKVVAPLNWFGHACNHTCKDIIPETWTRI